jgi:predicted glycogen debranching enzyme
MELQASIRQVPPPGSRSVKCRGDVMAFELTLSEAAHGKAWLRTNIGQAQAARRAVIEEVERNIPPLGMDWYDIPMRQVDRCRFTAHVPLSEVGHFEAKCFYLPEGQHQPLWPEGPNVSINVQPADTCCANIVYNAFVRQFGPNISGGAGPDADDQACMSRLDRKGYTVIPRSGTFRDLIEKLDFIIGELGCRFLHLLPIHPTPTTYGRMGRFGSPYAALNFTGIDPALAVFDVKATPLQQFGELVDAVHERFAKVIIDIAVNHTGWAATLHESHPRWLMRTAHGDIHRPGAWGVTWSDLTSLDYSQKDLWTYIARVFLTWCRRGVDGFRCDAGYMIPLPAWRYIIARVREQFPDTVFLLEGLGGKISVTRDLLNLANFNWAYSELFQNEDRRQIEFYLPEAIDISRQDGLAVHYAETHDNNRLAARSKTFARMRTALCALLSHQGGFGFANGVEWLADVKINVHEAHPLNWGAPDNLVDHLRRLHILLRSHPAFFQEVEMEFIHRSEGNAVVVRRSHKPSGKGLIIAVNLDDQKEVSVRWKTDPEMPGPHFIDLLSGRDVETTTQPDQDCGLLLAPGQVLCLTGDENDLQYLRQPKSLAFPPQRLVEQRVRAKVLEVFCLNRGCSDLGDFDIDDAAERLLDDPVQFCRLMNVQSQEHRVVFWDWPQDLRRHVMLPPGHLLLVRAPDPFSASVSDGQTFGESIWAHEESLMSSEGTHFVLLVFKKTMKTARHCRLKLVVYEKDGPRHEEAPLFILGNDETASFNPSWTRNDLIDQAPMFLSTNGIGGMCRAPLRWGELAGKYDALLAANLDQRYPVDRWIMLTRVRAWTVYQGFSQEICFHSLDRFWLDDNKGIWRFKVPTGQGQRIDLTVEVEMLPGQNTVRLSFHRLPARRGKGKLSDRAAVQLIVRPDIEDRNFHENTKAYQGLEAAWPAAFQCRLDAFIFTPSAGRVLTLSISEGIFVWQPEWHYMVHRRLEKERGMDPDSDLWSPGYFSVFLEGGKTAILTASVNERPSLPGDVASSVSGKSKSLEKTLRASLAAFVVRRGPLKSVIAGYPWFLDWGRDALIFTRCLIQVGKIPEAEDILKLLGGFEDQGPLPNMIHGGRAANRDTSDAPLWYIVALADLVRKKRSRAFLSETVEGRTIREIALSIGRWYIEGTPNRIRMDSETGLIFSPAHFTWMDTDNPACTPREGYCVEIQALWAAALHFLAAIDPVGSADWRNLSKKVRQSILQWFYTKKGYLSDCLHASEHESVACARADDAVRPNQLLALTLDAISDRFVGRNILDACQRLLVPGAIRSLADALTEFPLEIRHHGLLLGDPHRPYRGNYAGDEDTSRKPAYHNGTAWTWLYPSYSEAYVQVYGARGLVTARALLCGSLEILRKGCVGHFPEILDGDYPHRLRGCDAQAWGLGEWLRVWEKLKAVGKV